MLYNFIGKEKLEEMISSFYACTEISVEVRGQDGEILLSFGKSVRYYEKLIGETPLFPPSVKEAEGTLGQPCLSPCCDRFQKILFPLFHQTEVLATLLVGPFGVMDAEKDSAFPSAIPVPFHEVPWVSPEKAEQLIPLLTFLFSHFSQAKEEETVSTDSPLPCGDRREDSKHYPYEMEKLLITKVKTGDVLGANEILNHLLAYVLFSEETSLTMIQSRSIELCSLLSRAAIEGGAPSQTLLVMNQNFLKSILETEEFEEVCSKLQEAVKTFSESIILKSKMKQQAMIEKATNYMGQHFAERLTLDELAGHVHLSPTYFSSVFKESTGTSFKEHLNQLRVEESIKLLSSTDQSIIEISLSVGFEDQSYFSKVFKKHTGLSPKQYR
ncbi:MAG: AraC family transcriptional regulator [Eubacteriales bacterium]